MNVASQMQRWRTTIQEVVYGGLPVFTWNAEELATRFLVTAFFIAPPLFIVIENAPTAWGILAPLSVLPLYALYGGGIRTRWLLVPFAVSACVALLAALSAVWSIDAHRSLAGAFVFGAYVLLGFSIVQSLRALSPAHRERVWRALIAGGCVSLLLLAGYELMHATVDEPGELLNEVARTLHKTTYYGIIIASALLFDAILLRNRRRLIFVAVVFAVPTLLLGRSTGINFAILLIAALYFMNSVWRQRTLVIFCTCYVAFAFVAPWITPRLFQALSGTKLLDFYSGTFAARLELWDMVSQHVGRAWLFGHGADTMRIATYVIQNPKYYHLPDLPSAHSMVFDLWFELGLIGILVLLVIIVEVARRILRLTGAAQLACMSIFLATVIELSVDHRIWLSWMQGTLIFGVSICVLAILRQRAYLQQRPPVQ